MEQVIIENPILNSSFCEGVHPLGFGTPAIAMPHLVCKGRELDRKEYSVSSPGEVPCALHPRPSIGPLRSARPNTGSRLPAGTVRPHPADFGSLSSLPKLTLIEGFCRSCRPVPLLGQASRIIQ